MPKQVGLVRALSLITLFAGAGCSSSPAGDPGASPPAPNVGATQSALTGPSGFTNVALHHPVSASSYGYAQPVIPAPAYAVDGGPSLYAKAMTTSEASPWIAVNLLMPRQVEYVDVYSEQLDTTVQLLDAAFNVIASQPLRGIAPTDGAQRVRFANAAPATYVRVSGAPGVLSLGEVKAYARILPANLFPLSQYTPPASSPVCWKPTKGRGVGTIPTTCSGGEGKSGALCYPACRPGFTGVGPVCWQDCPSGWVSTGAFCHLEGSIIGANINACPWYDVCGIAVAKGCSTCPPGYSNDGCTCRIDPRDFAKASYGRGVGDVPGCAAGQEEQAGLCYGACAAGTRGVGPVCWTECAGDHGYDCGAACATTADECKKFLTTTTMDVGIMMVNLQLMVMSFGESAEAISVARDGALAAGTDATAALRDSIADELMSQSNELSRNTALATAQMMVDGANTGEIDWTLMDPTGIAAVVMVFNRPLC